MKIARTEKGEERPRIVSGTGKLRESLLEGRELPMAASEPDIASPFLQSENDRGRSPEQLGLANEATVQVENTNLHVFLSFRGASEWADGIKARTVGEDKIKWRELPAIPGNQARQFAAAREDAEAEALTARAEDGVETNVIIHDC